MTPPPSGMEGNLAAAVASPPLSLPSAPGECSDALECEPVSTRDQHHQDATEEGKCMVPIRPEAHNDARLCSPDWRVRNYQ